MFSVVSVYLINFFIDPLRLTISKSEQSLIFLTNSLAKIIFVMETAWIEGNVFIFIK